MILPSKKVLSILIIAVALVSAIIIAFGRDKSSGAINYASNLVVGQKVSIPENSNWQNELGKVVPATQTDQNTEATTSGQTLTDTVSTSLMSNYLAMQQSGTLDSTSAQKLIDQSASYVDQASGQVPQITQQDLNVIPNNGAQSISDYGENLGNILRNNKSKGGKNEITIINQAVQSNDPTKMAELNSVIAVYDKTLNELLEMPVPKVFVKVHLGMVNAANTMIYGLKKSETFFSDPMNGLISLQWYQSGITTLSQALQSIRDFIKLNKIIYKQGSGGYYLMNGV